MHPDSVNVGIGLGHRRHHYAHLVMGNHLLDEGTVEVSSSAQG